MSLSFGIETKKIESDTLKGIRLAMVPSFQCKPLLTMIDSDKVMEAGHGVKTPFGHGQGLMDSWHARLPTLANLFH